MSPAGSISFNETITATCPTCGATFAAEVWLIVDIAERSDLAGRARAGSLHRVTCPNGHSEDVDAPLLLSLPGQTPRLVFFPAEGTTAEQDREQGLALLRRVREQFGRGWQDEWLPDGLPVLPGALLETVLTEGTEAAFRRREELARMTPFSQAVAALSPEQRDRLQQLLANAETPEAFFAALAEQPALRAALDEAMSVAGVPGELGEAADGAVSVPPGFRNEVVSANEAEARYRRTSDLAALDEAVAAWERVLGHEEFSAADARFRLAVLNDAAGTRLRRYWAIGNLADLDAAIAAAQQAVDLTPDGSPDRAGRLNNLGTGLRARYARTGSAADLDAAITAAQQAVALTPDGSPDRAMYLNNLGNRLSEGYARTGSAADLDAAIAAAQQAVDLTPDGSPNRAMYLNNLGTGLSDRYARTGSAADLDAAIAAAQQAVDLTPDGSPNRAGYLNNLGNRLSDRYARTGSAADLDAAIAAWHAARESLHTAILSSSELGRLTADATAITSRLVRAYLERVQRPKALQALETGKALGLRLELTRTHRVPAGLTEREREEWQKRSHQLREIASKRRTLARAEHMPAGERDNHLAELSRQHGEALARVKELESRDPDFAVCPPDYPALRSLATAHDLTIVYLQPLDDATVAFLIHPRSAEQELLAEDVLSLDQLKHSDLGHLLFQLPEGMEWEPDDLLRLLATGKDGQSFGWLTAYWLTHFARFAASPNEMRQAAEEIWHHTMTRILGELGRRLIDPLARRLRALKARRVVLIPGGGLALLPLHAVPVTEGPVGASVFGDEFIVSFSPSGAALHRSLVRAARRRDGAPTLVAVANPDGSLVFADDEVDRIARRFAPASRRIAHGPDATRAWLERHVAAADFLELSTHGSFSPGNPAASALLLAHPQGHTAPLWLLRPAAQRQPLSALQEDCERLTLDDLWAGRLPLKEGCVVTADACETGQVDPGADAEESLGFPAALLGAGAASVIASLWAVDDLSTALLMDYAYELMLPPHRLSPAAALQQAALWLRTLPRADAVARLREEVRRLGAERAAGGWKSLAPPVYASYRYRLQGLKLRLSELEEGDAPPFSHPIHWAAFAAYGA